MAAFVPSLAAFRSGLHSEAKENRREGATLTL